MAAVPPPPAPPAPAPHPRRSSHRPPPLTPHDTLFKRLFTRLSAARGLLRTVLPPPILAHLDLRTLQLQPGSFVDPALTSRHTDILFSAKLAAERILLYVLMEHQSRTDPLMPFRLLAYMVRIWEAHLANHPHARRLPPILPVVVHHSPSGWTTPVTFGDLLEVDPPTLNAIRKYVPTFQFVLKDWSHEDDDAIRDSAMDTLSRLGALCLKHGRDTEELISRMPGWLDLVEEVRRAPDGAAALAMIWHYLVKVSGRSPARVLDKLLAAVDDRTRKEIMNIETYLLRKGERRGTRKGILEGRRQMLLDQLSTRFGALPAEVTTRIQAASAAALRRWGQQILTATTVEEALAPRR